jgi:hypothetical protein
MLRETLLGWVDDALFSCGYYSFYRVNRSDLLLARKVRQLHGLYLGLSPSEWVDIRDRYPKFGIVLGLLNPVEEKIGKTDKEVERDLSILRRLAAMYLDNSGVSGGLQVGDLVVWKSKGLKNRQYPELGMPAVVVAVLPRQKTYENDSKEPADLVLGTYAGGVLNVEHFNSSRFKRYENQDS